jgi:hypothetical protein
MFKRLRCILVVDFPAMQLAVVVSLPLAGSIHAQEGGSIFRNTAPNVAYVGSKGCGVPGCHEEITRTYMATPHGQSMAPANSPTELTRVPEPVTVFNPKNNRYYVVYQKSGTLYQSFFELGKNDRKVFGPSHKIEYVVGGESVGYTYLFRVGDWVFQAPLSFYAPSKSWELSPGYAADDPGFTRLITTGCLVCHNGQPDPVAKHDGQYNELPFRFGELGISCEACHGPGELHVREMQAHKDRVLAANEVDTSIVNPAKLSPRLADDICRECHQSGDAVVLYPNKGYMDFRPGTPLAETMAIVKRPIKPEQRAEANRLEVNPPVRGSLEQPLWWKNSTLELSWCYQKSHGRLTCSVCHSIHHAPRPEDEKAAYRAACLTCHKETSCKLKPDDQARTAVGDYCIECHMEKRAVAGIPHSNDTKHRIVRFPGQPLPDFVFEQPTPDLPGLLWLNRPLGNPEARLPDLVQLEAYWTSARKDSSLWPFWLKKLDELSHSASNNPEVLNSLGVLALAQKTDNVTAANYFTRALEQGSEEQSTFLNLATALENQGKTEEARAVLEQGVAAYPYSGALVARLALRCNADGKAWQAHSLIQSYRKLFPEDPAVRAAQQQIDAGANISIPTIGTGPLK